MKTLNLLIIAVLTTNLYASSDTRKLEIKASEVQFGTIQQLYTNKQYDDMLNELDIYYKEDWGTPNTIATVNLARPALVECDNIAANIQTRNAQEQQTIKEQQDSLQTIIDKPHDPDSGIKIPGRDSTQPTAYELAIKQDATNKKAVLTKRLAELVTQASDMKTIRERLTKLYDKFKLGDLTKVQQSIDLSLLADKRMDEGNAKEAYSLASKSLALWSVNRIAKTIIVEANDKWAEDLYEKATSAYNNNKYNEALDLVTDSLSKRPTCTYAVNLEKRVSNMLLVRALVPWGIGLFLLLVLIAIIQALKEKFS